MSHLAQLHERQVKWQQNAIQNAVSIREEELMQQHEKDVTFQPKLYTTVPAKVCFFYFLLLSLFNIY